MQSKAQKRRTVGASTRALRTAMVMSAVLFLAISSLSFSADPVSRQDIVAKRIGGFPLLHCRIRYKEDVIEGHLLFDTSLDVPVELHKGCVSGLGLHPDFATGQKVDVEFMGGVIWKGLTIRATRVHMLETLTREHANELGEVPVIGLIGPLAVRSNVIELDLRRQLLRTMGMASDAARAAELSYEREGNGIVVDGVGPTGKPIKVGLVTKTEDMVLAPTFLSAARKMKKQPNAFSVGKVGFGKLAAIRFSDPKEVWRGPVHAIIGSEALRNCTVTIWPKRKKIAFIAQPVSTFPQAEQDYFFALADKKADAVLKFINSGPRRRLLNEACIENFNILAENPRTTLQALTDALTVIAAKYQLERRTEALLRVADTVAQSKHPSAERLMMVALELAIRESGNAVQPTAVHDARMRMGKHALKKNDLKQARRHLLSAAFGMPKDGECNYFLGELYRRTNKKRRAWSRYFQAILDTKLEADDPIRIKSLERLDELNADPEFRKIFDMDTAEQYMAGRLADSEFHAKTRYRFMQEHFPGHVQLVELFVDSAYEGSGGMELAFQALDEFFSGKVAMIAYHIGDPMENKAAKARLDYYRKSSAPLGVFNGKPTITQGIEKGETLALIAADNYVEFRKASLKDKPNSKPTWRVDGTMSRDNGMIKVAVEVKGEEKTDGLKVHVILCEQSVMAVNANGVYFHHFIARDILTPADGLDVKNAVGKTVSYSVNPKDLHKKMVKEQPLSVGGGAASAPFVDGNMLLAVAIVQRSSDRAVLAAKTIRLPKKEE